ncbi:uncharacterized protein LOC123262556 [Cotesia glomerata]|uniref:uncharacterized protein LOC123262556 n=1 Tax=Cotesia glomerata TaxID=32391 RepID=UPI001D005A9F|nr:uncharacterized protein LOC123262556 [Cotesia glomerata]
MDESSLRKLTYKQLQSLAAKYNVPGNIKKDIMVKVILAAYDNDYTEVCRILSGIQHTRKKRFKHLKAFNENSMEISTHLANPNQTRAMQASPISWASKIELSSVKTPVHHYLIQHYQNTFLNTFPPPAPSPSLILPPSSLSALLPLPPPINSLTPPMPDSWLPQAPMVDLRIDQSQELLPLDLQHKTVLITHTQTSQYPATNQERSVLKQLLQPIKNINNKEVYDSDTMTAVTDSNDDISSDDNLYPNSCEPPPYTSPVYPYPQTVPDSSNPVQTQLISTDFWNYQSSAHQIESGLEITTYDSAKDNFSNYECIYPQNGYDEGNNYGSQQERSLLTYQDNENRLDNNNYDYVNYVNTANDYSFNESNENIHSNNYSEMNISDDINYNGHYKTKDRLINNANINEPLKDLMTCSNKWSCSKPMQKSASAASFGSVEGLRAEGSGINGQLESILNIRDIGDINKVNEKIGQTSSVYCYAEPVTSSGRQKSDKKRNFKLIAETRNHLFGIKYKLYDDSTTGRAMSQLD